ncbi:hypothetical protein HG530_013851 [Fusarium avenaceum]|nr:hypothetical protein HG530_013851 [Fusarium avenaceum]
MSKSSLETVPAEVLCMIAENLSTEDMKNFSLANSAVRIATAPCLFKVIQVKCPLLEDHITGTVLRKYGAHAMELRLNVTFFPNIAEGESHGRIPRDFLEYVQRHCCDHPDSVWARTAVDIPVIHDLIQFKGLPGCKSLTLHTKGDRDFRPCGYEDWDDDSPGTGPISTFDQHEGWEEVYRKEQKYCWRAALRDMYRDVACLSPAKELKILSFLPRKVSFWQADEWADFLGRLRKLTLHPLGEDRGGEWGTNTLPGYDQFFAELSNCMFTHAKELQHLEIVAQASGFLGSDSLVLEPDTMPALRVLHLEEMAVTRILTKFLQGIHKDLSKIHIVQCVALSESAIGEAEPSWASLWAWICEAVPEPKEITCVLPRAPLTREEADYRGGGVYVPPRSEPVEVKSLRARLAKERDFYAWPYAHDAKLGGVIYDEMMNLKRLECEEDNHEYRLMVEAVESVGGRCKIVLS